VKNVRKPQAAGGFLTHILEKVMHNVKKLKI